MNIVNPYILIPVITGFNLEIGGVSGTITNATDLAAKLLNYPSGTAFSTANIKNFTIVGSDIKCNITADYQINTFAFQSNTSITCFRDTESKLKRIKDRAFDGSTNLAELKADGVIEAEQLAITGTKIRQLVFPNLTSLILGNGQFSANPLLEIAYLPLCTTYGGTVGYDAIFSGAKTGLKAYANPTMATINSGGVEGDLAYVTSTLSGTVSYVTSFVAPSPVTTLAAGTIYNTAIQLNFTPPSSTNAIDFYEVYVNGVLSSKRVTSSGEYVTGLTPSTSYSDITLIAVDVFYNKSAVGNSISTATNTTSAVPTTGLVSYYKIDSNSNDSFGSNNGTDTSISYVAGKVSNAASFNGTTSTIVKASSSFDFFGSQNISFSCWIKPSVMPSSYIDLISIQEVGTPGTIDKSLRLYNNGSVGFYCFDGAVKNAQTIAGLVNTSEWNYLIGVFDGSNLKVYVNGVLRATLACSGSFNFTSPQLTIGKSSAGVFNGLIDEISIHSVALSQTQISLQFNNGAGTSL